MSEILIPHNRPCLGTEEESAAVEALRSGWVAQGPQVAAFEEEICQFLSLPSGNAVALSSGSAALYVALTAVGAGGRSVHAPSYSCRAVHNAIALAGAKSVWADVGTNSPNVAPASLDANKAPITIVAHMFGIPAALPGQNSTILIEDCAQSLGGEFDGSKLGTIGHVGIFSFGATKLMTSGGQGGMLVSRDREIVGYARKARDYDTIRDDLQRFNLQMTDLQAAIGRAQLRRISVFLMRRDKIFRRYAEAGLQLLDTHDENARPVRFRAVMLTDKPIYWQDRLAGAGIRAIVPVTEDELLTDSIAVPRATWLTRHTLSLPIYPALADDAVDQVIRQLTARTN